MLAVERRDKLARIEVGETHDLDFGEAELVFDGRGDRYGFRVIDAAAQDRRHLDLDPDAVLPRQKLGDDVLGASVPDDVTRAPRRPSRMRSAMPPHRRVDIGERGRPVLDRQIGEVDVHREARHVAHKEIDGRAALQGEAGFLATSGIVADQQRGLAAVFFRRCHRGSPAP